MVSHKRTLEMMNLNTDLADTDADPPSPDRRRRTEHWAKSPPQSPEGCNQLLDVIDHTTSDISMPRSSSVTATTATTACSICVEQFNKTNRKPFVSPCCPDFDVCRGCVGTFVMGSAHAPSCMTCKTVYSHETLVSEFTKKFIDELALEQANVFKETQRALLPGTMAHVQNLNRLATLEKEQAETWAEIKRLTGRRRELTGEIRDMKDVIAHPYLYNNHPDPADDPDPDVPTELRVHREVDAPRKFIMPCAHAECRGFVNNSYKCGMCQQYTCTKCLKPKVPGHEGAHVCDPDDVASVMEIRKNTKPCPKCGCRISKVSGCSQMFCTATGCGTVFDWNTLRIQVGGLVHNPEVHAFRERHGIAQGNGDAGGCDEPVGLWDVREAHDARKRMLLRVGRNDPQIESINEVAMTMASMVSARNHIEDIDIRRFRNDSSEERLLKLRVKYLRNEVSETDWSRQIRAIHKQIRKNGDYLAILNGAPEVITELLRVQLGNLRDGAEVELGQIKEFGRIMQVGLNRLNALYGNVGGGYHLPWVLVTNAYAPADEQ